MNEVNTFIKNAKSDFPTNHVDANTYQKAAMTTKKELGFQMDMFHAALGLSDEAGEFASAIKAALVYNKGRDKVNLVEELGDLLWFVSLAADTLEVPLGAVMEANISKLQVRYSDGYADAKAQNRVKELEREAIENVLIKHGVKF